jgi:hypothetical protein
MSCVTEANTPDAGNQDELGATVLDVLLPQAPPIVYVRWLTWCKAVERRQREMRNVIEFSPTASLAHAGCRQGSLLADLVASEVSEQARSARRAGLSYVTPRVRMHRALLASALRYLDQRRRRFERDGEAVEGRGPRLPAPGWDVLVLQGRVIASVYQQLIAGRVVRHRPARSLLRMAS